MIKICIIDLKRLQKIIAKKGKVFKAFGQIYYIRKRKLAKGLPMHKKITVSVEEEIIKKLRKTKKETGLSISAQLVYPYLNKQKEAENATEK